MLYIIIIIDNNYKIQIVAYAIIENETLDTYKWIFTKTDSSPKIIFTDSDPSMT